MSPNGQKSPDSPGSTESSESLGSSSTQKTTGTQPSSTRSPTESSAFFAKNLLLTQGVKEDSAILTYLTSYLIMANTAKPLLSAEELRKKCPLVSSSKIEMLLKYPLIAHCMRSGGKISIRLNDHLIDQLCEIADILQSQGRPLDSHSASALLERFTFISIVHRFIKNDYPLPTPISLIFENSAIYGKIIDLDNLKQLKGDVREKLSELRELLTPRKAASLDTLPKEPNHRGFGET